MSESDGKTFQFDKMKTNVRRIGYLFLFLFGDPSWSLLVTGTGIVLLAVLLHGWAAGYLARAGYENRETKLTLRGPYRHNRNPYYLAHMVMDFGFFLIAGLPFWYLLYFPFIFAVYRTWVMNEEEFLEQEFGEEYRAMKTVVPRWAFRLVPAEPRGHDEVFTWSDYLFNNELKRTLSHLCLVGLFWNIFLLGNPFLLLSTSTRVTIVGLIVCWVFLRDVKVKDTGTLRPSWVLGGGVAMSAGLLSVVGWRFDPLTFSTWLRSISVTGGIVLLGILIGYFIQAVRSKFEEFYTSTFKDPWLIGWLFVLSVSLLSGSIYVLWTGLLLLMAGRLFLIGGFLKSSLVLIRLE